MELYEYGLLEEKEEYGQFLYSFSGNIINEKSYHGDYYYEVDLICALNILGKESWELVIQTEEGYIMKRKIIK